MSVLGLDGAVNLDVRGKKTFSSTLDARLGKKLSHFFPFLSCPSVHEGLIFGVH